MTEISDKKLPIIKSQVTYLEMITNPKLQPVDLGDFILKRNLHPTVDEYIDIYKAVGRDYIWNYRPGQSKETIQKIIQSSNTWLYFVYQKEQVVGLAELDASNPQDIELVHFGLIPEFHNQGIGKKFLNNIIQVTWSNNIKRMWLSTCGMDHPQAISFYEKSGFKIIKTKFSEFKDYRFSDFYSLSDAPQIPFGVTE